MSQDGETVTSEYFPIIFFGDEQCAIRKIRYRIKQRSVESGLNFGDRDNAINRYSTISFYSGLSVIICNVITMINGATYFFYLK